MTVTHTANEATALRSEVANYGITLNPAVALKLLGHVGNRHLCVDALLMERRPAWLEEIVGKRQ